MAGRLKTGNTAGHCRYQRFAIIHAVSASAVTKKSSAEFGDKVDQPGQSLVDYSVVESQTAQPNRLLVCCPLAC